MNRSADRFRVFYGVIAGDPGSGFPGEAADPSMLLPTFDQEAMMCTTMILTRGAVADGSMLVAHSDDDELGDQRIIYVPPRKHSERQVLKGTTAYPRLVTDRRGPGYKMPGHPQTEVLGTIPQTEETYAYFDGNYGISNEHNLMMGECTNAAKYEPDAVSEEEARKTKKHTRLFYSDELSRVALERSKTAEAAVELMGTLLDQYGYFSYGETLLVVDEKEAWVFEMCALPDEEFHSVWVAERVPDGEIFVAANTFRIRDIDPESSDFRFSKHLFPGLKKVGWWDYAKDGPVDWMRAISPGEYGHPYYSLRRIWRVFDRVNPDLGLSPWVEDGFTRDYPFSVKPKRKLDLREVFGLYRDHYEGTPFDLTRGVAAGPYGDPHRFFGPYQPLAAHVCVDGYPRGFAGAWERPISVFDQGYTYVGQIRRDPPPGVPKKYDVPEATQGVVWFGPDVAYTTCFTPLFTKASDLPEAYQVGDPQVFPGLCDCDCDCGDKKAQSAWWPFDFVGNWCRLNFQRMTRQDILPVQAKLEIEAIEKLPEIDAQVKKLDKAEAIEAITKFCEDHGNHVVKRWRQLARFLVAKYADGYVNRSQGTPEHPKGKPAQEVGYPADWLRHTDYADGPTSYERPVTK